MQPPPLSVVMPVRNALPYLDAAIESVVGQSYTDFEFVIRDDGSTDGSRQRLRDWARRDSRISLFEGDRLGPAESSNFVVNQARAPIVARMDADDVVGSDRLLRQMEVLAARADAVLVGCLGHGIDSAGRTIVEPNNYSLGFVGFRAPFSHGSIMFRRQAFHDAGGYRQPCVYWEDLDLYLRMSQQGRLLVLTEPLYRYRFSPTSARLNDPRPDVERAVDLMLRCRTTFERGEDYTPLLAGHDRNRRIDPDVFLALAYLTLLSGQKPSLLRALIERGDLSIGAKAVKALLVATWAETSPRTIGYLVRWAMARRGKRARLQVRNSTVEEWPVRAGAAFS